VLCCRKRYKMSKRHTDQPTILSSSYRSPQEQILQYQLQVPKIVKSDEK
jgi:hypothetical protein